MGRTRKLSATWQDVLMELLRAVFGLAIAFAATEVVASAAGWGQSAGGLAATGAVFIGLALLALLITSGRPIQMSLREQRRAIAAQESVLRAAAARHQFAADLQNALDMAEDEEEAVGVAGRAVAAVHPGPAQLLLADSSRAHLKEALTATVSEVKGCGVTTPWSCPAVRRGMTLEFESSTDLAACPRLVERGGDLSAVCVPVTILGTPMGVLHAMAGSGAAQLPAERTNLETVAMQVGARVGVLRAMAASQLAASTDPLTGRLNRRTMEDRLRDLVRDGTDYAVVFADLDRFKALNDTYGHAAGDKALSHFARVLAGAVRDQDLVCRYGGEEFVLVFPHCRSHEAVPVVERIREELARTIPTAGVAAVTASFGVADSTYAAHADEVIACADAALLQAKRAGRDRVMVAERPSPDAPQPTVQLQPAGDHGVGVDGPQDAQQAVHPRLNVA